MPTVGSVAIMDEGRYAGRLAVASQRHLCNNIFKRIDRTGFVQVSGRSYPLINLDWIEMDVTDFGILGSKELSSDDNKSQPDD
jgi:hypothetical protein